MEGTYSDGYDEGYDDGVRDTEAEIDSEYRRGYDDGFQDAESERRGLRALLDRTSFNALEDVSVRWDAALKRWIFSQDGREVTYTDEEV